MEDLKPSEKPKILSNSDLLRIAIENQNYKQIDAWHARSQAAG